ncbi:hypothetical protein TWF694_009115 [Orbilia ellipsospora]|uniref:Uncharacterized protein n=1 Tax=Orbilia ellipsospora TaxID=2528407 RepID=A0AAV9XDX8_9PEZI
MSFPVFPGTIKTNANGSQLICEFTSDNVKYVFTGNLNFNIKPFEGAFGRFEYDMEDEDIAASEVDFHGSIGQEDILIRLDSGEVFKGGIEYDSPAEVRGKGSWKKG